MKPKEYLRWALYRFVEVFAFILLGFLHWLPNSMFRKVCGPLLGLVIHVTIPRKRVVRNLVGAFGRGYSSATINGLAKGIREHFARNLMDCFLQISDAEHARRVVSVEGIENLHTALSKGKGVIALGAHIGNFVLLGTRVGIEGYRFHTLFRMPPDRRINSLIWRLLPRFRQNIIPSQPRRVAVRSILQALKGNEIVFILGDNLKKGTIDARLFGQRVPSPRGPISLALRSGAPVVPMYLVREYHGRMQLVIEPELEMSHNGSLANDINVNTLRVVQYLENLIRRYPDQWNWLTVRMKRYQPEPPASKRFTLLKGQ